MTDDDMQIDDAVAKIMDKIGGDDAEEEQDSPLPSGDTGEETLPDEEVKPSEEEVVEPETAIEPPAGWRSDEKEMFKGLPREAQEVALRLQQSQDSHFTQRSTELAQEKRAAADERQQYQTERARFQAELGRVGQMAAQLLPAKFQDIQSESDYLRLKATDPARASEYEAFQMTLQMANNQSAQLQQAHDREHLDREWSLLLEKFPELRDETKARTTIDAVRKTAVDYYGFTPQEVTVIADHRYIPIIQDAAAWRQHQANLKSAQTKKLAPTPTKVLQRSATNGAANLADDQKSALLNRARKTENMRDKAAILARMI